MSTTGRRRVHVILAFLGLGCATNLKALAAHLGNASSTQDIKEVTSRMDFTSRLSGTRLLLDTRYGLTRRFPSLAGPPDVSV